MIVIRINDQEGAEQVYDLLTEGAPPGSVHLSQSSRGFDGTMTNEIIMLASIVSPVAIKAIADVLVGLIGAKAKREVQLNGVTIKGYSAAQVAELLAASGGQENQPKA